MSEKAYLLTSPSEARHNFGAFVPYGRNNDLERNRMRSTSRRRHGSLRQVQAIAARAIQHMPVHACRVKVPQRTTMMGFNPHPVVPRRS